MGQCALVYLIKHYTKLVYFGVLNKALHKAGILWYT